MAVLHPPCEKTCKRIEPVPSFPVSEGLVNRRITLRAGANRAWRTLNGSALISSMRVVMRRIAEFGYRARYPVMYFWMRGVVAPPSQVQRMIRAGQPVTPGFGGGWKKWMFLPMGCRGLNWADAMVSFFSYVPGVCRTGSLGNIPSVLDTDRRMLLGAKHKHRMNICYTPKWPRLGTKKSGLYWPISRMAVLSMQ